MDVGTVLNVASARYRKGTQGKNQEKKSHNCIPLPILFCAMLKMCGTQGPYVCLKCAGQIYV